MEDIPAIAAKSKNILSYSFYPHMKYDGHGDLGCFSTEYSVIHLIGENPMKIKQYDEYKEKGLQLIEKSIKINESDYKIEYSKNLDFKKMNKVGYYKNVIFIQEIGCYLFYSI